MSGVEGHIHLHEIVHVFEKKRNLYQKVTEHDLDFWSRDAVIGIKYNDLCSTVRNKMQ